MTTRGCRPSASSVVAREVEVDVAVVALPHLLDGEVEDLRGQPPSACPLHAPGGGTRAEPPRPPRAARASARLVASRCWSSWPGFASARRRRRRGAAASSRRSRSTRPARRAPATVRAAPRRWIGARAARMFPIAVVTSSGPTRCEPQRSCSFPRSSPCSYVPIEMCSAPWYEESSELRSAMTAGSEGEEPAEHLAHPGAEPREPRTRRTMSALAPIGAGDGGQLERHLRLRQPTLHRRQDGEGLDQARRSAQQRLLYLPRRGSSCTPTPRAAHRPAGGRRRPRPSARARARRLRAPFRRGESCLRSCPQDSPGQ